jgi:hypothetical protein
MTSLAGLILLLANGLQAVLNIFAPAMALCMGIIVLGYATWALWCMVVSIFQGTDEWKEHGVNIMLTSPLFAAAYLATKVADDGRDYADERADIIDAAVRDGRDPYQALKDAGLE